MSRAQIEFLHVRNAHAQTCAVWSEYVLFVFPFVYLFLFVWLKMPSSGLLNEAAHILLFWKMTQISVNCNVCLYKTSVSRYLSDPTQ